MDGCTSRMTFYYSKYGQEKAHSSVGSGILVSGIQMITVHILWLFSYHFTQEQ